MLAMLVSACGGESDPEDAVDPVGRYSIFECVDGCLEFFEDYFAGRFVDVSEDGTLVLFAAEETVMEASVDCDAESCVVAAMSSFVVEEYDDAGFIGAYIVEDLTLSIPGGCGGTLSFDYQCVDWFDGRSCSGSVTFQISCNQN